HPRGQLLVGGVDFFGLPEDPAAPLEILHRPEDASASLADALAESVGGVLGAIAPHQDGSYPEREFAQLVLGHVLRPPVDSFRQETNLPAFSSAVISEASSFLTGS